MLKECLWCERPFEKLSQPSDRFCCEACREAWGERKNVVVGDGVVWRKSDSKTGVTYHAHAIIDGTNVLLSASDRAWDVAVDGIAGDSRCEKSDGMRRMWLNGTAGDAYSARKAAEAVIHHRPTSFLPLDIGFDLVTIGTAVVLEKDDGSMDRVCHVRWADREGRERVMLANIHAVAAAMKKDGFKIKIEE